MQALILNSENKIEVVEIPRPKAQPTEVVVEVGAAALNHRDNWIAKGLYPGILANIVLGSDGAGVVEGTDVLINPSLFWGEDQRFQSESFEILGMPRHGTFAEYVAVPQSSIHVKPAHLSLEEAAALPLAGLTAYRALFSRCKLQAAETVLISGIGGGVSLIALLFATAIGAQVYVTSSSQEKIDFAKSLGAKEGFLYKEEGWGKQIVSSSGGVDVILDGAGGSSFSELIKTCRPGARIAVYGGTAGAWENIRPQDVFYKQIAIFGSTMGSSHDFQEMLQLVASKKISPHIDSNYSLSNAHSALERMNSGLQLGKIVLKM